MRNPFTIIEYYRGLKLIDVTIEGRDKVLHVNRAHFQEWLENTDRLEYITEVTPDINGEPIGGDTGTMTIPQYWESEWDVITQDLLEYILYHQPASFFDLKKSVDKVTNSHVHPTIMSAIQKHL